jgi:23S rRNA pseudouridine2605 synthase
VTARRGGRPAARPAAKKPAAAGASEGIRLQRYLAMAGVAARRKAEDLISLGRVKVNGVVVTQLGTRITPDRDQVLVDGEAVVALDHFYVLLNKPKACITAVTDDQGRPTVMEYLPNLPVPVVPVGRLDFYTEGVLLLTNDGELAARLLAPKSHVAKTYHVKVRGRIEPRHIEMLRSGVRLDDGSTTLPAEVEVLPAESKHSWIGITIHEGKQRQVHRMLEAFGYQVTKLQRVAFANLTFHGLRVGDARELSQQELNDLRDMVGLDHRAAARGRWTARRESTDISRRARGKAEAEREMERAINEQNRVENEKARIEAGGRPAWQNDRPSRGPDRRSQPAKRPALAPRPPFASSGASAPPARDTRPNRDPRAKRAELRAGQRAGATPSSAHPERARPRSGRAQSRDAPTPRPDSRGPRRGTRAPTPRGRGRGRS